MERLDLARGWVIPDKKDLLRSGFTTLNRSELNRLDFPEGMPFVKIEGDVLSEVEGKAKIDALYWGMKPVVGIVHFTQENLDKVGGLTGITCRSMNQCSMRVLDSVKHIDDLEEAEGVSDFIVRSNLRFHESLFVLDAEVGLLQGNEFTYLPYKDVYTEFIQRSVWNRFQLFWG